MNVRALFAVIPLALLAIGIAGCGSSQQAPAAGGVYVYVPPAATSTPAPGMFAYSVTQGSGALETQLARTIWLMSGTASGYQPDAVCAKNTHNTVYPLICNITYDVGDGTTGSYWADYTGSPNTGLYPAKYGYFYNLIPVKGNENPTRYTATTTTTTLDPTESPTAIAMNGMIMKPGNWPLAQAGPPDFLGSVPDEAICEDSSEKAGYTFHCIVNFGDTGTGALYWVNYDPQDDTKIIAEWDK